MISFFKYLLVCLWNARVILTILSVVALTGCESIRYYNHLISGQINIVNKNKPIHQLLDEPHVSEKLKAQLELVLDIRKFAKNELCLPVKNQYLSFVDLQRPFAACYAQNLVLSGGGLYGIPRIFFQTGCPGFWRQVEETRI
ncbi:MAG: aminopeptidase [Deltaproteobacteria bacterium]|nr:aminopeptidase [Deltaproteobacteria bacterium]